MGYKLGCNLFCVAFTTKSGLEPQTTQACEWHTRWFCGSRLASYSRLLNCGIVDELLQTLNTGKRRVQFDHLPEYHARHRHVIPGKRIPHFGSRSQGECVPSVALSSPKSALPKNIRACCAQSSASAWLVSHSVADAACIN
jgi:hypothetical protein